MIRSMTGYGKGEAGGNTHTVAAEIRAVNHRHGEISVRLPRNLLHLEAEIRKAVSARLRRGKIDVAVQVEKTALAAESVVVNVPVARAYMAALEKLRTELFLHGEVSLSFLASQRDVITFGEAQPEEEDLAPLVTQAVAAAIERHEAMRVSEGDALREDIVDRRDAVAGMIRRLHDQGPDLAREHFRKLKERVEKLLGESTGVDEGRLLQEVAVLADRTDITEETVRFFSHLKQFDEALESDEPVGRRLDFLLQEMNREINTIGSKASDSDVAAIVVSVKVELEKIREQVQNIE